MKRCKTAITQVRCLLEKNLNMPSKYTQNTSPNFTIGARNSLLLKGIFCSAGIG
jgi:hypothetical protein